MNGLVRKPRCRIILHDERAIDVQVSWAPHCAGEAGRGERVERRPQRTVEQPTSQRQLVHVGIAIGVHHCECGLAARCDM